MADICTGRSSRYSRAAGISKQIQYAYGPVGISDFVYHPIPVSGLLREQPGMLEVRWLNMEGKLSV
ncbi:hypothetical protein D3C78_1947740 [compost metagenome]